MLTRVPSNLPDQIEDALFRVIGAAIEVHRHLGPGYLESTYHRALCVELRLRGISFEVERRIDVVYKGESLHGQKLDLVVESLVVVEVKAEGHAFRELTLEQLEVYWQRVKSLNTKDTKDTKVSF